MPSLNLGIATLSFEVKYPTVDGQIDFTVPSNVPQLGGKVYTLPSFSLSVKSPSIQLPVNIPQFSGQISVSLNFTNCEVQASGTIDLGSQNSWPVGPASMPYMTPPVIKVPDWAVNPPFIPLQTLQQALNSAPASNIATQNSLEVHDDELTKLAIEFLFIFCGLGPYLVLLKAVPAACAVSINQAQGGQETTGTASDSATGGLLVAIGVADTVGLFLGVTGSYGFFVTLGGDVGVYGGYGVNAAVIGEISASFCFTVFWGSGGLSALQCFEGRNMVINVDITIDPVSISVAMYWPEDNTGFVLSNTPCGIAFSMGVGLGLPVDIFTTSSHTYIAALVPPPPEGSISLTGDASYWNTGLTVYWFSSLAQALSNWSTGAQSFNSGQLSQTNTTINGNDSGWLAVSGTSSSTGQQQLYMIVYYQVPSNLELGADGEQPEIGITGQPVPANFVTTTPPTLCTDYTPLSPLVLQYAFYSSFDDAAANWSSGSTNIGSGQLQAGLVGASIPSGWNWLALTTASTYPGESPTLLLITPYFSGMTGMVSSINNQVVLYVA